MLHIAICDDDTYFTGQLENLLLLEAKAIGINIETGVFFDGITLENNIKKGNQYDLIYMDIEMKQKNGIETARFIREKDKSVLLIYISSYEQYLKELFEVEPFRFLSKPLNKKLFIQYFHEACGRISKSSSYIQFNFNKEIRKVLIRNIVYCESQNRVIHIFLADGKEEYFYGKLNDLEKELQALNQRFLRIHQSYLVNYDYVRRMSFSRLILDTGNGIEYTLHISENRQEKIRAQLCEFASRKAVLL